MHASLILFGLFLVALPSTFAQLAAPTNIQADPKPRQVTLSWDAVTGALEYEVKIGYLKYFLSYVQLNPVSLANFKSSML